MQSVGKHVAVRLLTFFAILIGLLFIELYYQFGVPGVLTAIATSGLWVVGFFGTVWDKVKEPLTRRLDYLNQHAFTFLVEWCNSSRVYRISPDFDLGSKALDAMQLHRTYLTSGLYPKKLLKITKRIVENTPEYDKLWSDILEANTQWVQSHLNEWAPFGSNADMAALVSILGFENPNWPVRSEVVTLARPFVENYREKKPKEVARFVSLQSHFQRERTAMATILNEYMGTNMLHKSPTAGLPR